MVDLEEDNPTTSQTAASLLHRSIAEIKAFKDGTLVMSYDDGAVLTVSPDEKFEAWEVSTEHQEFSIVSMPGGDLAVWGSA